MNQMLPRRKEGRKGRREVKGETLEENREEIHINARRERLGSESEHRQTVKKS